MYYFTYVEPSSFTLKNRHDPGFKTEVNLYIKMGVLGVVNH